MITFRLATIEFAKDISGEGARLNGGRWNPIGLPALYLSEFISLSILEILVRTSKFNSPDSYSLITIQIPDDFLTIHFKNLKIDWQKNIHYTREIGEEFLKDNGNLCLKVPSAIVPQEHNYLVNPLHKEFKKVKILSTELLELDKRLYKKR